MNPFPTQALHRPALRTALAAVLASLLLAAPAFAKGASKPAARAVPQANSAGVLEVFGVDGKEPATWPDQGNPWKKVNQKVQGRSGGIDVTLAYTDIEGPTAEKRVHFGANPFTLPNGIYTYVILRDGTVSFGHPLDAWEVGTRHAHLAQGHKVVGSGELLKSNGSIKLNLLSGTFMIPMIKNKKVPNAKFLETRITTWFDKVLRAKYQPDASFKVPFSTEGEGTYDNEIIFDVKLSPPTESALSKMCGYKHFKLNNDKLCDSGKGAGRKGG